MSNPLHANYYPDRAMQQTVRVLGKEYLAQDTFCLQLECPEIARRILPGQFVMLRLERCNDPLVGRAMALYDTVTSDDGETMELEVVFRVMGKMTSRLCHMVAGQELQIWGPLGNGFLPEPTEHLVMVAGGIGYTPFMALAREYLGSRAYGDPPRKVQITKVTLCYGERSGQFLAGVEDFERLGVDVRLATDDGSTGHHGLVTDLLTDLLKQVIEESKASSCRVVCCGPEPMMEATAKIALAAGIRCQVSLETPMACGIGICFSCVAKVYDSSGAWDYKRTCVEGPVFDAEKIQW